MGHFTVNTVGAKSCPADSEIIADSKTCKEAAALAGLPFADDAIEEGQPCHLCNGCVPAMIRTNAQHGKLAKFICKNTAPKVAQAQPQASTSSGATSEGWPSCQEPNTVI